MRRHTGFTLLEIVITLGIVVILSTLMSTLVASGLRGLEQNRQQVEAQENARTALTRVTKYIREALPSNNGSYPIAAAAAQSLTVFANADTDDDREQVRIFLDGTALKVGITQPVGEPAAYPAASEEVQTIASSVVTGAAAVFQYYDQNYTGTQAALTLPVAVQDVRLVRVTLTIDADSTKPPAPMEVQVVVSFRNLKENL